MLKKLFSVLFFIFPVVFLCSCNASGITRSVISDFAEAVDSNRKQIQVVPFEKTAEEQTTVTECITTEVTDFLVPNSFQIDVPVLYQEPELPTGCEITSLTMLLNYLGFDVSKTTMAYDYLTKDYKGDVGFDEAFIGSPDSYGGYGCFAPVIKEAANKYLAANAEDYLASNITGTDMEGLYEYVAKGFPVVAWCSMELMDVYYRFVFTDAKGNDVYWYDNEHCVLLCGYSKENKTVTVADPMYGMMTYYAPRFEEIYNQLGKQAVIIEKIKESDVTS